MLGSPLFILVAGLTLGAPGASFGPTPVYGTRGGRIEWGPEPVLDFLFICGILSCSVPGGLAHHGYPWVRLLPVEVGSWWFSGFRQGNLIHYINGLWQILATKVVIFGLFIKDLKLYELSYPFTVSGINEAFITLFLSWGRKNLSFNEHV